jgi:hypothetical protein
MEKKKLLWIQYSQKVTYAIGIDVKDLSEETINELLELDGGKYNASLNPKEVDMIRSYVDDSFACDWGDMEDVNVYIE